MREVHHVALLIGYGAAAINPYLAMETVEDLVRHQVITTVDAQTAVKNLIKALGKGVLKVMSKMGISTVASYRGAQVFEALGLSQTLVDEYFTPRPPASAASGSTSSPRRSRSATAWPTPSRGRSAPTARSRRAGSTSGAARASRTCSTPRRSSAAALHAFAQRGPLPQVHLPRGRAVRAPHDAARGLLQLKKGTREPVDVDEVEPVSEIVKRFSTGAMSYGSSRRRRTRSSRSR